MRKLISVWCLSLALSASNAAAADNLVINGGFEFGLTGWRPLWSRPAEAGSLGLDQQSAHQGVNAARIDHRGAEDWSFEPDPRQRSRLPGRLALTNAVIVVSLDTTNATLSVLDRRTGCGWNQQAMQPDVIVTAARRRSNHLAINLVHVPSGLELQARLELDQGGHAAIAKRYRQHARQTGLLKTLAEKRRANPNVDLLVGAVNVWNWDSDPVALAKEMQAAGMPATSP